MTQPIELAALALKTIEVALHGAATRFRGAHPVVLTGSTGEAPLTTQGDTLDLYRVEGARRSQTELITETVSLTLQ